MEEQMREPQGLLYGVSCKVTTAQMDELDIVNQVTGKARGTILREAFEDHVSGLSAVPDPAYQCVRDWRIAKAQHRIINRRAWVDAWVREYNGSIKSDE